MKKNWFPVIMTLLALLLCQQFWQSYSWKKGYDSLTPGLSKGKVLDIMGNPSKTEFVDPQDPLWDQKALGSEFKKATEQWYYSNTTMFLEAWVVGFDSDGHLVQRWHMVSP